MFVLNSNSAIDSQQSKAFAVVDAEAQTVDSRQMSRLFRAVHLERDEMHMRDQQ